MGSTNVTGTTELIKNPPNNLNLSSFLIRVSRKRPRAYSTNLPICKLQPCQKSILSLLFKSNSMFTFYVEKGSLIPTMI